MDITTGDQQPGSSGESERLMVAEGASPDMGSSKVENNGSTPDNQNDAAQTDDDGIFKGWVLAVICLVYVLLIALGGVIFHYIESPKETETLESTVSDSLAKFQHFLENNTCVSQEDLLVFVEDVIKSYDSGVTMSNTTVEQATSWDIVSSMFFCTTIVTTVGYGNIAPATAGGRVFAVLFAILGIPLFVIVSGQLGIRFTGLCGKITSRAVRNLTDETWKSLISTLIVILMGFTVFMLAAAGLFAGVETWSYDEALYYTFITLTTIGLGDYVPGYADGLEKNSIPSTFYRMFVSMWIIFGLVWMASVVSAISDTVLYLVKSAARRTRTNQDQSRAQSRADQSDTNLEVIS